jgi:hypothetical protein
MAEGRLCYGGPTGSITQFFQVDPSDCASPNSPLCQDVKSDWTCPEHTNPADFIMDVISTHPGSDGHAQKSILLLHKAWDNKYVSPQFIDNDYSLTKKWGYPTRMSDQVCYIQSQAVR